MSQNIALAIPSYTPEFENTTDGQALEWGRYYLLHEGFSYDFPSVTETGGTNWIEALPANGDWQTFTGQWDGTGTDTVGTGQIGALSASNEVLTFLGSLGTPNNITIHEGRVAATAPSATPDPAHVVVDNRAALPDPTTLISGAVYVVTNDPDPTLNGPVTAIGPVGGNAVGWL